MREIKNKQLSESCKVSFRAAETSPVNSSSSRAFPRGVMKFIAVVGGCVWYGRAGECRRNRITQVGHAETEEQVNVRKSQHRSKLDDRRQGRNLRIGAFSKLRRFGRKVEGWESS